jgi:hypothetical protein
VSFHYGFLNRDNFEETCVPLEICKRLLARARPLDLHEAFMKGRLFEFAAEYDKMEEDHRRSMCTFTCCRLRDEINHRASQGAVNCLYELQSALAGRYSP